MTTLSRPVGEQPDKDDPVQRLRQLSYRERRVVYRGLIEGEDAYYLEQAANDRGYTVDALVKQFVIEGLWRHRTNVGREL